MRRRLGLHASLQVAPDSSNVLPRASKAARLRPLFPLQHFIGLEQRRLREEPNSLPTCQGSTYKKEFPTHASLTRCFFSKGERDYEKENSFRCWFHRRLHRRHNSIRDPCEERSSPRELQRRSLPAVPGRLRALADSRQLLSLRQGPLR